LSTSSIRYQRPRVGPIVQFRTLAGYEWNRVELSIPQLPRALEGLRLIHWSDLHLRRRWPAELGEVADRINALPADLVLFTGDFVDSKKDHRPALPAVERLIKSLRPTVGIFAVMGNHDGDLLAPRLLPLGVRVLINERSEIVIRGAPLELIGLAGADRIDLDERFVRTAIPPKRPGVPRIVMCHYPDVLRIARAIEPDLYLAGHTHGGQICLPNERALMSHDTYPKRLCKGAHDVEGTCLIVSRGFGFTTIPLRVFCPAEVVEIEFKVRREA
jgi:predicted MPP superfamily phosphohydrolase